jgi:hypothetical protein
MDKLKHLLRQLQQRVSALQHKELIVENNTLPMLYTEDQLMARLRFFIGICLALTLTGIVFVVLYSIIFVTQPLNAISPIDQKFFELIIPVATFLTGTLSGIMLAGGDKDLKAKALDAANKPATVSPPLSMGPRPTNSFSTPGMPSPSFGNRPMATPAAMFTGAALGAGASFVANSIDSSEMLPGQSPKFTDD